MKQHISEAREFCQFSFFLTSLTSQGKSDPSKPSKESNNSRNPRYKITVSLKFIQENSVYRILIISQTPSTKTPRKHINFKNVSIFSQALLCSFNRLLHPIFLNPFLACRKCLSLWGCFLEQLLHFAH